MPQWGRPPGARIGRRSSSRRRLVRQLEEEESAALQVQLDGSDNDNSHEDEEFDDGQTEDGGCGGLFLDSPRARRRQRQQLHDATTGSGEDDDGEEYGLRNAYSDPTLAYAVQLAMQDDDDWLVENALEKIRRSQRRGKPAVNLSQHELAALERSRLQSRHDDGGKPKSRAGSRRVSSATSSPQYAMRTSDANMFAAPAQSPSSPSQQQQQQHPHPHTPTLGSPYPQPYPQPLNPASRPPSSAPASASASARVHQPIPQWSPPMGSSNGYMPPPPPPFPQFPPSSFGPYGRPPYASMVHCSSHAPPENVYQQPMYPAPVTSQAASNPVSAQQAHAIPNSSPKRPGWTNSSDSNNSDNGVRVGSNNNNNRNRNRNNSDNNAAGAPADPSASPATSEKNKKTTTKKSAAASNGNVMGRRKRKTGR